MTWLKKKVRLRTQPTLSAADAAFMDDVRQSLLSQSPPSSRRMLYLILAVLLAAICWAWFARVEEITRGEATIIPQSREQVIQSLEGGILVEMNVREGDIVDKGQVLLKIDPTRAKASYSEAYSKALGLKASIARLRAEAYQAPLEFPEDVLEDVAITGKEAQAYQARKRALEQSVAASHRSHTLAMKEIDLARPLVARGLMSEVELLRMQRQANDLQIQVVEHRNKFRAEASAELARSELELSQTIANLVGRADIVDRTTLNAPLYGTVKNIRVHTIGGVIQPGEHILEIVPLQDQLLVEAKIKPADVAFLRPGLPATVKLSAYDYGVYGGLLGRLQLVSADTLKDEANAASGRPDDSYYRVLVLTDSNALQVAGRRLPIIPGMTATVEIRTGEKTVLDYLLKPVFKAKEAFRER
ncbi:HlyD family type I secretion periplasmic adaptor subunit [Stenotrophomonas sp. SAU14A_NAIMI4_8]|uniref:HlyD family type I secretion periplasmic adaptor subunit n=1 Tax=Stenotrophomonas sp. SAU14A_NAIMI4_8 TaxID=2072409 RepID=UPI000D53EC20|nr:HlyD family type I secretion periplasmic adaptor subunit [Stenotrophomonas sp. SAU14A_NAIMI4_8]AWH33926.1 hemolysin secretion protein D [Stenotrophomonas sp. SAU14A_NAIMI4_8]